VLVELEPLATIQLCSYSHGRHRYSAVQ